jgi:hypothetical protein
MGHANLWFLKEPQKAHRKIAVIQMMTTMMIIFTGTKDDWKCSGDKA